MGWFRSGRRVEFLSVAVIAFAVAVGGRSFLYTLSHSGVLAGFWIAGLALFLLSTIRRRRTLGATPLTLTRDVAFVAAALFSLVYIASPARWSSGATIAALEFALVLELLSSVLPQATEA